MWGMKLIFCQQINRKVFHKFIVSLVLTQTCPNIQHNKFAVSLQYLKAQVKDEVDSLPAYKCKRFL